MKLFGVDTLDWRQVKIDWDAITDDTIKAGTPMDKEGHICNDGNVYGILMDDVHRNRNTQGRVVISGCVDLKAAEEHSGIKLSSEAKAALPDVWSQGGVSSWNDLTDKPFIVDGTPDTLTWDGNKGGLVVAAGVFYKVSDAVPTMKDLANGYEVSIVMDGVENTVAFGVDSIMDNGTELVLADELVLIVHTVDANADIPETGIYFLDLAIVSDSPAHISGLTIPGYTGFGTVQIDPKVLPEALRFGKTTVQGDTLTWDGNTDSLVTVGNYYKVADTTPSNDEIKLGSFTIVSNGAEATYSITDPTVLSNSVFETDYAMIVQHVFVARKAGATYGTLIAPEPGIYFISLGSMHIIALTTPGFTNYTSTKVKTIDPVYLPIIPVKKLPGAVILHVGTDEGDVYLYADSNASERITRAELIEMVRSGRAIYLDCVDSYVLVTNVKDVDTYASAIAVKGYETGGTMAVAYYTAEYTAE